MLKVKTALEQLMEERRKSIQLKTALDKANADIEYVAMMADIELEEPETEAGNDGAE